MKLEQARHRVKRFQEQFAERYGEGHYIFACHAAFPVGFTPDLLYQIWANFREYPIEGEEDTTAEVDLIAISDLLLSPLCKKTGHDLYEMDVKVRAVLLDELRTERFARLNRMDELAYFIFQYLDSIVAQYEYESFRETLYWNTLVTIAPQQAFHEVTQKLGEYIQENNEGEIMRMRNLLESFAYQDKGVEKAASSNFGKLLSYTKALKASILDYPTTVINQQMKESGAIAFTTDPNIAQGSIEIPLLEGMVGKVEMPEREGPEAEVPPIPTKEVFALTVGVDEYLYPSLRLNGCINDVNLVNTYLRETLNEDHDYRLELTSLTNEKATVEGVRATLERFRTEAGPEDIVFFYFAGHSVKDQIGLDYTSLVLYDTRIEWEDRDVTKVDEFQLETLIAKDWACEVVLMLDTHYSAATLKNDYPHVIFFASCGADQQSFEHRIGNRTNGLFTFSAIKALRESKQRLTYQQVFQALLPIMRDSGYDQTPVLRANQEQVYKYFLGEYAPQSEELMNRIEAARTAQSVEIDLSGFDLTFIPQEVFALDHLEVLNLSDNQLDGIPNKLTVLEQLRRLDLRNNRITRLNLDVLSMPSLKEIFLSGNAIPNISPEILDGDINQLKGYLEEIKKDARSLFALFIAIDNYPKIRLGDPAKLRGAVSDGQSLRQTLKEHFQVDRELDFLHWDLFNEAATRDQVFETIQNISERISENDVFLCYFAGHDTTLSSGERAWVLANSTGNFNAREEITAGDLSRLIQPMLDRFANIILLNPPEWDESIIHENLVVVEPGIYNNEGVMPNGTYHSWFAYELAQAFDQEDGALSYQFFQNMNNRTPPFARARTDRKNTPVVKTTNLNLGKTFLRDELGYGREIRQRVREATSSNVLDLSGMNLDHLPSFVYELENLTVLNLAGNGIEFLPRRVIELKSLERLELEGNPILNLPQSFLIEGSIRDIRNYFESLEVVDVEIPVILSIFCELEEEMKDLPEEIERALKAQRENELIITEALTDPTTDELFRLFYKYQNSEIALFNLSANTNQDTIQLLNPAGRKTELGFATFMQLITNNVAIKVALLDGSYSEVWANNLTLAGVSAAIGVQGGSTVSQAMQFWRTFYRHLSQGKTIQQAFDLVKLMFEREGGGAWQQQQWQRQQRQQQRPTQQQQQQQQRQ